MGGTGNTGGLSTALVTTVASWETRTGVAHPWTKQASLRWPSGWTRSLLFPPKPNRTISGFFGIN